MIHRPVRSARGLAAYRAVVRGVALMGLLLVAQPAFASEARVPYVPTPQAVVDRMLEMGGVKAGDYLIDLGSGDGRIVVTAARRYGVRGFGVDINPERIAEANANAQKAGVTDKVAFQQRDLFEAELSSATVITMYLLPRVNLELRPRLLELKPGTRIVSHDFSMDDWRPDAQSQVDAPDKYGGSGGTSDIFLWVVPARVAGSWQFEIPLRNRTLTYEMLLSQRYQTFTGTARLAGQPVRLEATRLRGDEIEFAFTADIDGQPVRHVLRGRVDGDAVSGRAELSGARYQGQHDWSARRIARGN